MTDIEQILNGAEGSETTPLYTTPTTATALVADFKRRAVEVCNSVVDRAMFVGEQDYWVVQVRNAIDSLPLIGEK